jgi:hypothetical protein
MGVQMATFASDFQPEFFQTLLSGEVGWPPKEDSQDAVIG